MLAAMAVRRSRPDFISLDWMPSLLTAMAVPLWLVGCVGLVRRSDGVPCERNLIIGSGLALLGGEVVQVAIPRMRFDLADLVASACGTLAVLALSEFLRRRAESV